LQILELDPEVETDISCPAECSNSKEVYQSRTWVDKNENVAIPIMRNREIYIAEFQIWYFYIGRLGLGAVEVPSGRGSGGCDLDVSFDNKIVTIRVEELNFGGGGSAAVSNVLFQRASPSEQFRLSSQADANSTDNRTLPSSIRPKDQVDVCSCS